MRQGNSKNNNFPQCPSVSIVFVNTCMAAEDKSIYLTICRILKTLEGPRMSKLTVFYRDTGMRDTTLSAKRDHAICLVYQVLPGVSTQDLR